MNLFMDYGELLFRYDFNAVSLRRAHEIALEVLERDGKFFDESSLNTAHEEVIHSYLKSREGLRERPMSQIMAELTRNLGIEDSNGLIEKLTRIYQSQDHDAYPLQGIPELIPRLAREHSLHIISNLPHDSAVAELAQFGLLPYFDSITFSYQAGYRKPHPRIYELAMERARARNGLFLSHDEEEVDGARKLGLDSELVFTAEDIEVALN